MTRRQDLLIQILCGSGNWLIGGLQSGSGTLEQLFSHPETKGGIFVSLTTPRSPL